VLKLPRYNGVHEYLVLKKRRDFSLSIGATSFPLLRSGCENPSHSMPCDLHMLKYRVRNNNSHSWNEGLERARSQV
jgi:hypothetical protein